MFLLDTGEGVTAITPEFAATVGCKPWGRISGFRMNGERLDMPRCDDLVFELGGHRFKAPIVGVFDIMHLLPDSPVRLSGAVGLDIFVGHAVTLQSLRNRLIIESHASLAARVTKTKRRPSGSCEDVEGVAPSCRRWGSDGAGPGLDGARLWQWWNPCCGQTSRDSLRP